MNANNLELLNSFLNANFEPHLHYAVREFFDKMITLDVYTPEQLRKMMTQDGVSVYNEKFFDDHLAYDYTHEFSCYDAGQYHKRDDLYVTVDHKYIVQQNIF